MVNSFTFKLYRFGGTFPFTTTGVFSARLFAYSFFTISFVSTIFALDCILYFLPESFGVNDWAIEICNIVEIFANLGILLAHAFSLARNKTDFERFWTSSGLTSIRQFEAVVLISSVISCMNDTVIYYDEGYLNEISWVLDLLVYIITVTTVGMIQAQFIAAFEDLGERMENITRRIRRHIAILEHSKFVSLNTMAVELYGWHVLFSVLLVVVSFVRMSYEIYTNFIKKDYIPFVFTTGNLLVKFVQLMVIVHVCEINNAKALAFNEALFKLMREDDNLCRDNKLFLYVTMKQTVNFSACGFFTLEYPLVTSIIAAATTYLVILLQFSMPKT